MVAFDILEKKDIQKVEQKINALFGIEPKEQKSHISFWAGYDSFEVSHNVWKTNLSEALTVFQKISAEGRFPINRARAHSEGATKEVR